MSQGCGSNTNIRSMYSVCVYITLILLLSPILQLLMEQKQTPVPAAIRLLNSHTNGR